MAIKQRVNDVRVSEYFPYPLHLPLYFGSSEERFLIFTVICFLFLMTWKLERCATDLLDDGFEPPLGAHQCDGSNDFSMEHAQGPVLTHAHTQLLFLLINISYKLLRASDRRKWCGGSGPSRLTQTSLSPDWLSTPISIFFFCKNRNIHLNRTVLKTSLSSPPVHNSQQ